MDDSFVIMQLIMLSIERDNMHLEVKASQNIPVIYLFIFTFGNACPWSKLWAERLCWCCVSLYCSLHKSPFLANVQALKYAYEQVQLFCSEEKPKRLQILLERKENSVAVFHRD